MKMIILIDLIFSLDDFKNFILGSLLTIFTYIANVLKNNYLNWRLKKSITGDWYSYHFTRRNYNSIFQKTRWKIRTRSFKKGMIVRIDEIGSQKKELKYYGSVEFDDSFVVLNLEGEGHSERIQVRLLKPIPNDDTIMLGFHLGQDFDHELFVTVCLVCKNARSDEDAKKILHESSIWIEDEKVMRLSKKPIPTLNGDDKILK